VDSAAIEFREVSFRTPPGASVLDRFSLTVNDGEVLVLVWRSGAGKTTVLKLINRLLVPAAGAVHVGGRDTRESFKTRMLARWDRKTWKMLADGVDYVACPDAPVGVWAHVHGGQVDIVRVPMVADADAVAYINAGRLPAKPLFHGDPLPAFEGVSRPAVAGPVSLAEAVQHLPGPPSLDALRKRVQRAGIEPVHSAAGGASLYLLEDLEALYALS
jgi:energy-coupling factor transporter ATP-binding protein EcfA2